jgi:hypothetical protein
MDEPVRIDSELAARDWLNRLHAAYVPKATPAVEIDLPSFTPAENRSLTREARRLHNACGCSEAGLAMTVVVLAFAYRFATDGVPLSAVPWSSWILALAAVAAASSLAKIIALMTAQRRLVALAEQVCRPGENARGIITAEH